MFVHNKIPFCLRFYPFLYAILYHNVLWNEKKIEVSLHTIMHKLVELNITNVNHLRVTADSSMSTRQATSKCIKLNFWAFWRMKNNGHRTWKVNNSFLGWQTIFWFNYLVIWYSYKSKTLAIFHWCVCKIQKLMPFFVTIERSGGEEEVL